MFTKPVNIDVSSYINPPAVTRAGQVTKPVTGDGSGNAAVPLATESAGYRNPAAGVDRERLDRPMPSIRAWNELVAERDRLRAALDAVQAIIDQADADPSVHIGEIRSALAAASLGVSQTTNEQGEWQYGIQTEFGWVTEIRGENYALMRRRATYGQPEWLDARPAVRGVSHLDETDEGTQQ